MRGHYTRAQIIRALREAGVQAGDTMFSHVSLLNLGLMTGVRSADVLVQEFTSAILEVIGADGCFLTPTYSYSFCKHEDFYLDRTPSDCGPFSNMFLKMSNVRRSLDPIFSVAGTGQVGTLFDHLPATSFGEDCLYQRLLDRNVKVVNIGLTLEYLTAIHHLEKKLSVPYRYDKVFSGNLINGSQQKTLDWIYYVRDLDVPSEPDCSELERVGLEKGLVKKVPLGLGHLTAVSLVPYFQLAEQCQQNDPWFLTRGAAWKTKP